ncbi:MaoC family dehydratase N-terminal domain-containing protein [Aquisalimonas sp.]|uniref:FAS1-like dehydratase domain-containing protein n=1 Tax=Aquisalimonas sp. TaxID=1872621 RepID=UPI0025C19268|nr:MaoC family dehydratase N-terminal domain-containing protein [Aquisalimonas sp.]
MAKRSLQDWIGTSVSVVDRITAAPARGLAATLDREQAPAEGDDLPPLWHWLYFLDTPATGDLGRDGHAGRGGFLPPVHLPRRMWAGSRLRFHQALRIGEATRRTSRIANVVGKQGRTGELVIVTVEHTVHGESGLAITEEVDIAYREAPQTDAPATAPEPIQPPGATQWSYDITPGPVLLFRYSALTFNSHRIHYDQPYATEVEGYPGLVVHGPLTLTLLAEALAREHPRQRITSLTMRAFRPLFHGTPFHLQGRLSPDGGGAELWTLDGDGGMTMQATAELAD